MNSVGPDAEELPVLVAGELERADGTVPVTVLHAGVIGLFSSDAVMLLSKLVEEPVDVVVYGVELRAFPTNPPIRSATRLPEQMSPRDLMRLYRAGGAAWLPTVLDPEKVASGALYALWATYAYRSQLRFFLWEYALEPLRVIAPTLHADLKPATATNPFDNVQPGKAATLDWPESEYGAPNANWSALETFGALCQQYLPGRCVVYAGPINPLHREQLVEPDFYSKYLARLQDLAQRYGWIYRDFTDAALAADFRTPRYRTRLRDPIHLNPDGRQKLAKVLAEPVAEALAKLPSVPLAHTTSDLQGSQ